MKAAFFTYRNRERGENASFTEEDLSSCMKNESPGTPDLSVMSFTGAFHGRLMGTLSLTRSKAIHKVDVRKSQSLSPLSQNYVELLTLTQLLSNGQLFRGQLYNTQWPIMLQRTRKQKQKR